MCFKAGPIFITAEGTVVAQSANNAVITPISTQPIKTGKKNRILARQGVFLHFSVITENFFKKIKALLWLTVPVRTPCLSIWNNNVHTFVLSFVCPAGRSLQSPCQLNAAISSLCGSFSTVDLFEAGEWQSPSIPLHSHTHTHTHSDSQIAYLHIMYTLCVCNMP